MESAFSLFWLKLHLVLAEMERSFHSSSFPTGNFYLLKAENKNHENRHK